jgi:hypothetical protein
MLILSVGRAQTQACVLHLTPPATSQRHTGRLTTSPLLTTRGLASRRLGIATQATRLASHRRGCHAVVWHGSALSEEVDGSVVPLRPCRAASRHRARAPRHPVCWQPKTSPGAPCHGARGRHASCVRWRTSHPGDSRGSATPQSAATRSVPCAKPLARGTSARAQTTQALTDAHARLRQRESHTPAVAVVPTGEVGGRSRRRL